MQIPNQYGSEKEDLKITKDEMKKIERAMKKPEFQGLMSEYMKEISDPKNREVQSILIFILHFQEYDEYLR